MSVLELKVPQQGKRPVIVEVPHAGTQIPEALRGEIEVPSDAILRDADLFVDRLFEQAPEAGATLLAARLSRFVVDLNRDPEDVDVGLLAEPHTAKGPSRGVIWRSTTDGRPVLPRRLTAESIHLRVQNYYVPYHAEVRRQLEADRARFGYVVLVAAHSMPSSPGRGWDRRADIVPGSLGRSSAAAAVIELVDQHFRAAGLSVRHDDPYRGGFTTAHYGRPGLGQHAVQIEINRALYMDEQTCSPKPGDFEEIQNIARALVHKLGELSLA